MAGLDLKKKQSTEMVYIIDPTGGKRKSPGIDCDYFASIYDQLNAYTNFNPFGAANCH